MRFEIAKSAKAGGRTIVLIVRWSLCANIGLSLIVPTLAAGQGSTYQLIDSGFPSDEQYQPFWLDNERVIFKGYEVGSYSKEMHERPSEGRAKGYDMRGMRTGYYIWDAKTNKVSLYKDKIANLCVEDGNVIYEAIPTEEAEKRVVWRGKFGEEQPTDIEPARWTFTELKATCWDVASRRTEAQKGRRAIPLRPSWGYLDVGPSDPPFDLAAPVLYYSPEHTQPLKLPIPVGKLVNGGFVLFVPHEGKHLIVEGLKNAANVPHAWFLSRDGNLKDVILPPGPWLNVELHPVRGGMFLTSVHTKGKRLSEPGGAYLIPDGQWWRLLFTGVKGRAGVSPNGCKVALTVAPDEKAYRESFREWMAGRPGQKTMRVIDVCRGDRK